MGAKISKTSSFKGKLSDLSKKFATCKLLQSPDQSSTAIKNKLNRKKVMTTRASNQTKNRKLRDLMNVEDHCLKSYPGRPSRTLLDSISVDDEHCSVKRSSKRVHPHSTRSARKRTSLSFEGRPTFSLETLVILDRKADQYFSTIPMSVDVSSVSRRQSAGGKPKKVRFKPVEETDIYTFYSPNQ